MKTIVIILTGLMLIFYGCTTQTTNKPEDKEIKIKQPTEHYLSENDMQDYINDEINLAIDMGNEFILKDAANALNDTRNVMEAIRNKNYREARERLTQAMGKTKLLLAGSNTKALASITVEINQGVKNVNEAYQLINEIDSLVSNKEYQKARNLMPLLSNEILITRESLLINKFDEVLKRADQVFRAKEYEKAFQELNGLTTTTSFEYTVIPLPVIKAEKMIAEAAILLNKEDH
ncbi:MAG: YfdX family protein [Prolixibacteraceae bacterium]|nr:YfdX family protein [Prolixibacteraceae bacterium]